MSNNQIIKIEDGAFSNLTNLIILDLSNNHLVTSSLTIETFRGKYDPSTLLPMKHLKILKLGNNNLHSLDPDVFDHFPNLEELYLDTNPFKILDLGSMMAINSVTELKLLDLSYMELQTISDEMFHRPAKLKILDLRGNLLTDLPRALQWAVNVENLTLDNNPIRSIEGDHIFPLLPNLKYLSLSFMPSIFEIGRGGLSGCGNLTTLYISNNPHLSYIDGQALCRDGQEVKERHEWPHIKNVSNWFNQTKLYLIFEINFRFVSITIIYHI